MLEPVCLITGATDGVGKATALELAKKHFTVVLAARSESKAKAVATEIAQRTGNTKINYILGDLSSLKEIRRLADTFKQTYERLDVLVNNAGIFSPRRQLTEDGFEQTYQVNYLSHFLLTHLLLEALKRSNQGRIINLTSNIYTMGRYDHDVAKAETQFSTIGAYATSKLLMLIFTLELADRLRDTLITANAVHPGVVKTHMLTSATGMFKLISYLARPFAVSPETGAATSVLLASSPNLAHITGEYFTKCKAAPIKSKFTTEKDRRLLWARSMEQVLAYTPH